MSPEEGPMKYWLTAPTAEVAGVEKKGGGRV